MITYYCNCCGFEFSEEEAFRSEHNENAIICPMCEAMRWDDDDNSVIEKINGNKEIEDE